MDEPGKYHKMKCSKTGWLIIARTVLLLCVFFAASGLAWAAPDSPVAIKAEIGWPGGVVPGKYGPVVVHLKNSGGNDLSGVVEAINYNSIQPPPPPGSPPGSTQPARYVPAAAFAERVALPAGAEKSITLWIPMKGPGERVDFVFRTGDGELARVEEKVPGSAVDGPVPGGVGVLGQVPPALERVRVDMPDGVPRAPVVLQLSEDLFPVRGDELDAFRNILVTGAGAAALNGEQRKALAEWVKTGGQLVVSGGLEINEALAALPKGTLSINAGEMAQRSDWQPAARWLNKTGPGPVAAAVAHISGSGQPWGPAESPLGMKWALGEGSVTVLCFNPDKAPWQAGALGEGLWQNFLAPPDKGRWDQDPYYRGNRLVNMSHLTGNLPQDAFPGWRSVGFFLLAFLILAGPFTYWLLRRIRRPEYTWVAVPCLALLFAGMVYLYMLQSGGNVLVNVVQVVDGRNSGQPTLYTSVGYFAPTRPDLDAVLANPDRPVLAQPMGGRPPDMMKEDDQPPYSVIRGPDLTVRFSEASQWDMRVVSFRDDEVNTAKGLSAYVEINGNKIAGTVQNDTGLDLDHVVIFHGTEYRVLGDLAEGKSAGAELPVSVPQYNPQGEPYRVPSWLVFMYPDGPPPPSQPGNPAPQRRLSVGDQRRANLMNSWMENIIYRGPEGISWPLTVLAWSDSAAGDPGLKGIYRPPYYLTMFVLKPEIRLPAGPFTIPAGLIAPEIETANYRGMFSHSNLLGLDGGWALYSFKPNLPQGTRVDEITLRFDYFPTQVNVKGGMGPPAPAPAAVPEGVLEIYDPGKGAWQPLSGAGTYTLPGRFASAGGEVRVRVTGGDSSQSTGFYFLPPTVAYGGEKA